MRVLHVGDDFAWLRPCGLTLYSDALMRAQAVRGHQVSYVFSGRHYPRLPRPRLKRWSYERISMFELVGSPNQSHPEVGTRYPERDLAEPAGEAAFATALREASPDLVHIHELARLPSSVIDHARAAGRPVVMTLYDYKPVCAAVRLLDADGHRCLKHQIGEDCARNCAGAPEGVAHLVDRTLRYERRRAKRALPGGMGDVEISLRLRPWIEQATSALSGARQGARSAGPGAIPSLPAAPPDSYQRRRDVNIARLGRCDRLIAISDRMAEIYTTLGVDDSRMCVQRLTLPHFQQLMPAGGPEVNGPVRFVTVGGCSSATKGSQVILDAVHRLQEAGRGADYQLLVLGDVEQAAAERLASIPSVSLQASYGRRNDLSLLDGMHVGIMPSVWEEPHGFVGIEMLAKGLPVIGSALGGIPEYVQPGVTGWLNHSATGTELAELMMRAIDHPEEVERLRRSVRAGRSELVRPMDDHVDEVESLYAELVSSAGPVASR